MIARMIWLPLGHIAHGYRRVFAIHDADERLRHVVVLSPLPYEAVYGISQFAGERGVKDPSLWWGLSALVLLVKNGVLLNPANREIADDGYLQIKPQILTGEELLPLAAYDAVLEEEEFRFSYEGR